MTDYDDLCARLEKDAASFQTTKTAFTMSDLTAHNVASDIRAIITAFRDMRSGIDVLEANKNAAHNRAYENLVRAEAAEQRVATLESKLATLTKES